MPDVELLPRDWSQLRQTLLASTGVAVFSVVVLLSHRGLGGGLLVILAVVLGTMALLRLLQAAQWLRRGNPPTVPATLDGRVGKIEITAMGLLWRPRNGETVETTWAEVQKLGLVPVSAASEISRLVVTYRNGSASTFNLSQSVVRIARLLRGDATQ